MNEMLAAAWSGRPQSPRCSDDLADGLTDDAMAWTPLASPETYRSEADQDPRPTTWRSSPTSSSRAA
jgi:hypothetical protein